MTTLGVRSLRSVCLALVLALLAMPAFGGAVGAASGLTKQEQTFLDDLQDQADDFQEASTSLGKQFNKMGQDPTVIFDQQWIMQTAVPMAQLQQLEKDARALKPSARQQHLYVTWNEIAGLLSSATIDFTNGIDNIDPESFDIGSAKVIQATALINGLTTDMIAFRSNPDVVADKAKAIDSPVADCSPFEDYNVAQVYLALNPAESATLDPNDDGRACEVYFARDAAA